MADTEKEIKPAADKAPDVQHFLDLIRQSRRGKFKIYIGMSAGVGKTFRMLQEAQTLLRSGVDVKIGYVETHGRSETEDLLQGLPVLPRRRLFYKGKELEELDILDAGINVISAVNIQHIESLYEEIRDITGIEVSERIPDSVLEEADEVVNIDLTADELVTRLKEGKIYAADKIAIALQNFFQPKRYCS